MSGINTPPQMQFSPPTFAPLQPVIAAAGPSNDAAMMMRYDANKKSLVVAYILLFVVGSLGAHRFYLGRTGSAVAMLVITLVSWLLLFVLVGALGLIAVGIWVIVDACRLPGMVQAWNNRLIGQLRDGSAVTL